MSETKPSLNGLPARSVVELSALITPQTGRRRWVVLSILVLPAMLVCCVDWFLRGERVLHFSAIHKACYAATVLESALLWGLLLCAASGQKRRYAWPSTALFVVAFTFSVGGQVYFFEQYQAYITEDLSVFAANLFDSVVNQLIADRSAYLAAKAPFLLGAIGVLGLARGVITRGEQPRWFVRWSPALFIGCCFLPTQFRNPQAATPDTLYLSSLGALVRSELGLRNEGRKLRPGVRTSPPLPELRSQLASPRNILLVITESVRADSACSEYTESCREMPATNELLRGRYPLLQMRSVASTTATSLAVLWSGLAPTESRRTLHTWPLIYDYANAAGFDTAYWTSQNLLFGNARLWVKHLGARLSTNATLLEPEADIDLGADEELLADHVIESLPQLKEPFFATLHLSNTHYPYRLDEDRVTPFQPYSFNKAPAHRSEFLNYYRNSIAQQDQALARVVRALQKSAAGRRTVIVYTSDHGEAFREHGQMGHTSSLFDEEIHVPAYVYVPPGVLSEEEAAALVAAADEYTFHTDIVPTLLDLMGLGSAPQLQRFRDRMPGRSLLRRKLGNEPMVKMSNCSAVWSCAFANWAVMRGSLKATARTSFDTGVKCFDVALDPLEKTPLSRADCADLMPAFRDVQRTLAR